MKNLKILAATALAALVSCKSAPETKPVQPSGAPAVPIASPSQPPATQVAGAGPSAPSPAGSASTSAAGSIAQSSADAVAKAPPPLGVDESVMDKTVDPCTDFYQYACGSWLKKTPIPEDRATWGRGFSEIFQRNEALLHDILDKAAKGEPDKADPFSDKVGSFYATCMDEDKAETASLATLKEELAQIDAAKDAKGLAKIVARLHREGANVFFGFGSQQDFKDATQVIGGVDQGGLGMPDRDYYLKDEKRMSDLRFAYKAHVAKMLELAGDKNTEKEAARVMEIELALAKASMDKVERRDPNKVYHRLERKGLKKDAPHFLWDTYFEVVGAPAVQAINVTSPAFFKGMDALLVKPNLADLHTYLRWHAIEGAANMLGKSFVEERFNWTRNLTGAKAILPRWKRCAAMTDAALGEALGRSFVTTTLGDEGKAMAREMIQNIEKAFEANLANVDWMDPAARTASLDKLHKINNKVGYPDQWRDYSSVNIGRESLLANARAAAEFENKRDLNKIGKPVDRAEWGMTPPTVNAYYNPSLNEMVFPAGIMQTPFFKPEAPVPSNYGGLGMVMGHELTHGFDDQGRQFDGDGNLHEWWSKTVGKAFDERAACVAKQYDGYVAVDDLHLNGKLTLGENIADIGGLKMALAALRARGAAHPAKAAGAFSDDQQLFLSFAQSWCTNYRPEAARTQAQTNPHSTAQWRVNGPVSDNPEFEKAFSCKPGSPMAPANRCSVW
jgi:putative endopeptidase